MADVIQRKAETARYFDSLNLVDQLLEGSFVVLRKLEDEELVMLNDYLKGMQQRLWKLRCALCFEVKRRVYERGGKLKDLEEVAHQFGMSLRTFYRKAQIWETFFVLASNREYLFETFDNAEDWFIRALMAADPVEAIRYAEKRWEELEGDYSPSRFATEIVSGRRRSEDWTVFVAMVPRDKVDVIKAALRRAAVEAGMTDYRNESRLMGFGLLKILGALGPGDEP